MLGKAVGIVAVVFLMVALGIALRRWGFLRGANVPTLLSKLVVQVGLPSMMVSQLFRYYTRESLLAGLPSLGVAYLSVLLIHCLSLLVARLVHIPEKRRGLFSALFTYGNTIFVGLPVNAALFGEKALPATLLYYIANTSLFWLLGVMGIQRDGGGIQGKVLSLQTLRSLLTPPLLSFIICGTLIFLGIGLPTFLLDTAGYLGNIVTPLSLLFLGVMLADMLAEGLRWERGYGFIIAAHFLFSPALILLLTHLFGGMPQLYRCAFLVQASMPVQTSCAIAAHTYHADAQYATGAVTITTLLSVVTIPLFAMLTTYL